MATPNMNMNVPTPGVTSGAGYLWAQLITAALNIIDGHDHSTGKGAKVTPAGMNISSDLTFNSLYKAINLAGLMMTVQGAIPTGVANYGQIFAYGSPGDLYFLDFSNNPVRLTKGGNICVSADLDVGSFNLTNVKSMFLVSQGSSSGNNQLIQLAGNLQFTDTNGNVGILMSSGAVDRPQSQLINTSPFSLNPKNNDLVVMVDTTAARTINLPTASITRKFIIIKDSTGNAATNNITINRAGSDTIEGATSTTINVAYGTKTLFSDGTSKWLVLSKI